MGEEYCVYRVDYNIENPVLSEHESGRKGAGPTSGGGERLRERFKNDFGALSAKVDTDIQVVECRTDQEVKQENPELIEKMKSYNQDYVDPTGEDPNRTGPAEMWAEERSDELR